MLSRVKSVSLKQIQEKTSSRTTDLQHHTSSNIWFIQHFGNFANFPPWKCHGYFQEVWLEPGVRLVCRSAAPCSLQWALYVKKRCNFTCILRIYREEQWYLLGFKHWTLYQALAQKLGGNYDSHSGAFFLHSAFYRLHLLVYFSGKIRLFCTKRGRFFLCWIPIILWRYRQLRVSGLQHEPRVIFSFPGLGCWLCHPLLVSWGHRFNNFNSLMTSHDLLFLFVVLLRYPDGAFESRYPLHIEECWELKLFLGWNRNESFIGHHLGDLRYPAKGIAALVTCFPTFLRCFAWKELGHRKLGSLKAGDPCVHDGYGLWCVHWGQGCLGRLRQHLLEDAVFLLVTQQSYLWCWSPATKSCNKGKHHSSVTICFSMAFKARMLTATGWFVTISLPQHRSRFVAECVSCFQNSLMWKHLGPGLRQRKRLGAFQKFVWSSPGRHFEALDCVSWCWCGKWLRRATTIARTLPK